MEPTDWKMNAQINKTIDECYWAQLLEETIEKVKIMVQANPSEWNKRAEANQVKLMMMQTPRGQQSFDTVNAMVDNRYFGQITEVVSVFTDIEADSFLFMPEDAEFMLPVPPPTPSESEKMF